jgi:methylthioribulose-1-phosphate dehydratase
MTKPGDAARVSASEAGRILATEASRFAARGWMLGTAGNLSVRASADPLRFFITASGKDKGELSPDDVALAGSDGEAIADPERPGAPRPSAEAGLHARIYRRTGAGAIFHVHTVSAVAVGARHSAEGAVEVEGLEMLKGIGREAEGDRVRIPIVANHQNMSVLGERFEKSHDPKTPGLIVASHGLYAWGKDPLQARHHLEIFEWLFQYIAAS